MSLPLILPLLVIVTSELPYRSVIRDAVALRAVVGK